MTFYPRGRYTSLKFKIAFASTTAILLIIALLATVSLSVMRRDIMANAAAAQKILMDKVVQDLDYKVDQRKEALALSAAVMSRIGNFKPAYLDEFYNARPILIGLFDFVFIADRDGKITYDFPALPGRRGRSISDRAYFKSVMQTGMPIVSNPVSGKTTNAPQVTFANPIHSASGEVIGMIGGVLFLDKPNFLTHLGKEKIGKHGYFALVTKEATPTIIMHAQRERIMQAAPGAKTNPQFASALLGFEGTVEGTDSSGLTGLHSFRSLKSAPWIVTAAYPADDAFALIQERQAQIIGIGIFLAVLSGVSLWALAGWLIRPLKQLGEVMTADMENKPGLALPEPTTRELANAVLAYAALREHKQRFESALIKSEERVRSILAHAGDAFVSIDGNGIVTEWNRQAEDTLGWLRHEAIGKPLAGLIIPEAMHDTHALAMKRLMASGQSMVASRRVEVTAMHKDGHPIPIELSVTASKSDSGYAANAFLRDISERKTAEAKLEESEQRLREITNNLPVLISYVDKEWRYRFANETYRSWFGMSPESMVGKHVREVAGPLYGQLHDNFAKAMNGEHVKFELQEIINGKECSIQRTYVPHKSGSGEVCGIYVLCNDVSAMKAVERELAALARIDSLTGLPNRRNFEEKLDEAIARSQRLKKPLALMFIDVDNFKSINDSLGHAAGDLVLKEFAARLRNTVRRTDTVARLGGDEFMVILEGVKNQDEPKLVAKKIITAICEIFYLGNATLKVTTSIGIAFDPDSKLSAIELTAKADEALYERKEAGRDGFHVAVG